MLKKLKSGLKALAGALVDLVANIVYQGPR